MKFALYCTSILWSTEILISKLSIHGKLNIQSTLITQTPFNSNCFFVSLQCSSYQGCTVLTRESVLIYSLSFGQAVCTCTSPKVISTSPKKMIFLFFREKLLLPTKQVILNTELTESEVIIRKPQTSLSVNGRG